MNDNCSKSEHALYSCKCDCNNPVEKNIEAVENDPTHTSDQPFLMLQVDGNDSLSSASSEVTTSSSSSLSSSIVQSECQYSALPKLYSANARSVFPKFDDLVEKEIWV